MFIVVCRFCQRRWSRNWTPTFRDQRVNRCPACGGTDFLVLGDVPGVSAPPLFPDVQGPTLPVRIHVSPDVLRATGLAPRPVPKPGPPPVLALPAPAPVFALTNFSETTTFAQTFGTGILAALSNVLHNRKELLFALSDDGCAVLRPCPNAIAELIALVNALHPDGGVNGLNSQEIAECVVWLGRGGGALTAAGLIKLIKELAASVNGIFGRDIHKLIRSLVRANTEPVTPLEVCEMLATLTHGASCVTAVQASKIIDSLLISLTPKQCASFLLALHAHGTGISGSQIRALLISMASGRTKTETRDFRLLTEHLVIGDQALTPTAFLDLTLDLRKTCSPVEVEWIYTTLCGPLPPIATGTLCQDFLSPAMHRLTGKELWKFLQLLLEASTPCTVGEVSELVQWLLHNALAALTPQQVFTLTGTLLEHGTPLPCDRFYKFVKGCVGTRVHPLSAVQFDTIVTQLTTLGTPLSPVGALELCSGVMQDAPGSLNGTPTRIVAFLGVFTTAGVFDPVSMHGLALQCYREELGGAQMLALCQDLIIAGPARLSCAETRECLGLLRKKKVGLSAADTVGLIHSLCAVPLGALTPQQTRTFLRHLLAGVSALSPALAQALINGFCTGVSPLTPTAALALLDAYPGHASPLSATGFSAMVTTLRGPAHGLDSTQIDLLLRRLSPGPTGLSPAEARALLALLLVGGTPINPTEVYGLFNHLFNTLAAPLGIRSKKSAELLERLINGDGPNGITAARAKVFVEAALGSFTPANLHALCTTPGQLSGATRRIAPSYLFSCSQVVGPHTFVALAQAAHHGGHVSLQELTDIIAQADASAVPAANLCTLLHYLPTVHTTGTHGRAYRIKRFLREAIGHGRSWAQIFASLASFVAAGRAPFTAAGIAYSPFADNVTGINTGGVGMEISQVYNPGGYNVNFRLSANRVNYFCNAHTFRYFNFRWTARSPQISLWGAATTRPGIIATVLAALLAGGLDQVIDDAANDAGHYTSTNAYGANSDADIGGIYYNGGHVFYLHHYHSVGVGGETIPTPVLDALAWLFS